VGIAHIEPPVRSLPDMRGDDRPDDLLREPETCGRRDDVVLDSGCVGDRTDLESIDRSRSGLRDRIEGHAGERRLVRRESQAEVGHQADEPVVGDSTEVDDELLMTLPLDRDGRGNPVAGRRRVGDQDLVEQTDWQARRQQDDPVLSSDHGVRHGRVHL